MRSLSAPTRLIEGGGAFSLKITPSAFSHALLLSLFLAGSLLVEKALATDPPPPTGPSTSIDAGYTNFTVPAAGIVTITFSAQSSSSSANTGGSAAAPLALPDSFFFVIPQGSDNEALPTFIPSDAIASLSLTNSYGGVTIGTAVGSALSLSISNYDNGLSQLFSYSASSGSSTANGALGGTPVLDSSSGSVSHASSPISYSVTEGGTLSFYAASGKYTLGYNGGTTSSTTTGSSTVAAAGQIGISSISTPAASKVPSGSISVSQMEGGAGGVKLIWTITPPGP